jgi:Xaa-Pro aminopeptidase
MKLFSAETYQNRRNELKKSLKSGKILFLGNDEAPMNYTDNIYRFRQDSNFLYFFGLNLPGLAAIIDIDKNTETIFGNEYSIDDIIWVGQQETISDLAAKVGINKVESLSKLKSSLIISEVHYLPPYRGDNKIKLAELIGLQISDIKPSIALIKSVINLRSYKSAKEIEQMHDAVNITGLMHIAAIKAIKSGKMEYEIVAEIMQTMYANHAELAYGVIFSTNGQTLHNHNHSLKMMAGKLALNDSGAENQMCYAGDITRTMPVNGKFTTQQKEIYNTVLAMETQSIESLKPGITYKDVHLAVNRILLDNLKSIGLLNGNTDDMLNEGVGGLFMPHGLGHMIGLDVHDMEDLGENYVGYAETNVRSTQLGLKSLRLSKKLEAGYALTVEPGCYFIPELIDKYKAEGKFKEFVNYSALENYKDFGGIRIEDNLLITETGQQLIGKYIPKTVEEIEGLMG